MLSHKKAMIGNTDCIIFFKRNATENNDFLLSDSQYQIYKINSLSTTLSSAA
jgi:hypothetical protein